MIALDLALAALALPLALAGGYLALLALLSGTRTPAVRRMATVRFDVVIPAHDEATVLGFTVANLQGLDYPRPLFRVWVVADNCADRTAETARAAGANVLVRQDPARRSKGHALAWAFERLLADDFAEAFAVVDADSLATPGLLTAFAAHIADGAQALQARYGVRNPDASWRTRLMALAFCLTHDVRSRARERLGLSCGLRGNGMAFTRETLTAVPYRAFSLTEDVEYGIDLALAGRRVRYVAEAEVRGLMPNAEPAARTQRERWEDGRRALRRRRAWALVRKGFAQRDPVLLDLAIDLLVPPLSWLVALSGLGLAGSVLATALGVRLVAASILFAAACLGLLAYVARGCLVAGTPLVALLLWAPVFVVWKLGLRLRRRARPAGVWVRTAREHTP